MPFWMTNFPSTPGFLRHWKSFSHAGQYAQKYGAAITKRLMANYIRSLLLPTPVASEQELASGVEEFNTIYGLYSEVRPGTLDLLEQSWQAAKQFVARVVSGSRSKTERPGQVNGPNF